MQGFGPAIIARELLLRTSPLRPGKWLFALVTLSILGVSATYEFTEWWAAIAGGDAAGAFLGTQGDVWDTQWDMFLAGCGAIVAQAVAVSSPRPAAAATAALPGGPSGSQPWEREMYESRHQSLLTRQRFLRRMGASFRPCRCRSRRVPCRRHAGLPCFEGLPWIDGFLNSAMLLGGMGPVNPPLTAAGNCSPVSMRFTPGWFSRDGGARRHAGPAPGAASLSYERKSLRPHPSPAGRLSESARRTSAHAPAAPAANHTDSALSW